jgi:hypothetical protein
MRKFDPLVDSEIINRAEKKAIGYNQSNSIKLGLFGNFMCAFNRFFYFIEQISLNSFWNNVYHLEDEGLNDIYEVLFQEFAKYTFESLFENLNTISYNSSIFIDISSPYSILANNKSQDIYKNLQYVEAFYLDSSLQGFILNFKLGKSPIAFSFEAFFELKHPINLINKAQESNSSHEFTRIQKTFFELLVQVSFRNDSNKILEKSFETYGIVLDQQCDPTLTLRFRPNNMSQVNFSIMWLNPSGK